MEAEFLKVAGVTLVELLWVLLRRESRGDSTSRPWNFGDVEFPQEARVTPLELSIDSAVGLLFNLKAARQGRSVLLSDEQILLLKEGNRGLNRTPKWIL
jgi:hypothetical protein